MINEPVRVKEKLNEWRSKLVFEEAPIYEKIKNERYSYGFYQDLSDKLYCVALDEFACSTFDESYVEYQKLDKAEQHLVNYIFHCDHSGLPVSSCKDIIFNKLIMKRLKIEKKRCKNDPKTIDAMIDQVGDEIIRFRLKNLDVLYNHHGDFDWKVLNYISEKSSIEIAKEEVQKCYFTKQGISVFEDDEWKNVNTGEIIIIKEVAEHYDINNYKRLYAVCIKKSDDEVNNNSRSILIELSELRKNYDLHLMNLDYVHELFYDKNQCNCDDYY